jgi:cytochrome P450
MQSIGIEAPVSVPLHEVSHLVPQARFFDRLMFFADVALPTLAKGVIMRRPNVVALAERFDLDRRAIHRMQRLRERYGAGPLFMRIFGRNLAIVLDPRDVHRILAETPDPFSTATVDKRAALSHFEPKNVLISTGSERTERRRFQEQALDADQPIQHLADSFVEVVRSEAGYLKNIARRRGELNWDEFSGAWFRMVRRVVFGNAAREDHQLSVMMAKLRAAANWAFLRRQRPNLREALLSRIRGYLVRAEPGSLAGAMVSIHKHADTAPDHQVPQWLFAFDPAGMATYRALALLLWDRDRASRAREEITRDASRQIQPYLRASLLESLRLWPTAPFILRETTRQTSWKAGILPANTEVVIFTPFFHRDDERLPYADTFTPELWLYEQIREDEAIVPFSEGPAACPGRHLVLLLGTTMLAELLENEIHLKSPVRLRPDQAMPATLNPFALRFEVHA